MNTTHIPTDKEIAAQARWFAQVALSQPRGSEERERVIAEGRAWCEAAYEAQRAARR